MHKLIFHAFWFISSFIQENWKLALILVTVIPFGLTLIVVGLCVLCCYTHRNGSKPWNWCFLHMRSSSLFKSPTTKLKLCWKKPDTISIRLCECLRFEKIILKIEINRSPWTWRPVKKSSSGRPLYTSAPTKEPMVDSFATTDQPNKAIHTKTTVYEYAWKNVRF